MKKKLLLTVNVITYNHAPYLRDCLDSILKQKTSFGFIVRIFDDASTDGTQDICREYKSKYPDKIELYLSKKNLGRDKSNVFINAVRSYKNIKTPYYLFIEGDDMRQNINGFQRQVDILESHPECICCASRTINYRDGKFYDSHPNLKEGIYTKEDCINKPRQINLVNLGARIARTSAIKINPKHTKLFVWDVGQHYTLMLGGGMYFCDDVFFIYRQTGTGVSTSLSLTSHLKKFITSFDELIQQMPMFEFHIIKFFLVNMMAYFEVECAKLKPILPNSTVQANTKKIGLRKKIHKVEHYFLPPLVIDILHIPRNVLRFIRKKTKKVEHYVLPPFIIDILHIPRDTSRFIRRKIHEQQMITPRDKKDSK